jgi:hypothetical protein
MQVCAYTYCNTCAVEVLIVTSVARRLETQMYRGWCTGGQRRGPGQAKALFMYVASRVVQGRALSWRLKRWSNDVPGVFVCVCVKSHIKGD